MTKQKAAFKILTLEQLDQGALSGYQRYQKTTNAWYPKHHPIDSYPHGHYLEDCFVLKDIEFIDDWDILQKAKVIHSLRRTLLGGGFVIGSYLRNTLIAFASVNGQVFGSTRQYQEMLYFHVDSRYRGQGFGRALFQRCVEEASRYPISKLYLSAHPSQETQAFYTAMGCVLTQEINQAIYQREPFDIQLEYLLPVVTNS